MEEGENIREKKTVKKRERRQEFGNYRKIKNK